MKTTTYTILESKQPVNMCINLKNDLDDNQKERLNFILHSSQDLLNHAFMTSSIHYEDNAIHFDDLSAALTDASMQFVTKLMDYVKGNKHIYEEETFINEKCAFICLMLKIGMIGSSYRTSRTILAENLNGSPCFITSLHS